MSTYNPSAEKQIWVYIAGPYTKPDPVANTHRALKFATSIRKQNVIPFVPHMTLLWQAVTPQPYDFWLKIGLDYLKRCDALYRLSGESEGSDKEEKFAHQHGIPVFHDLKDFWDWVRRELYGR